MKSSEISSVTVGTKFKCEYKMTSGLQPTNFSPRNSVIRISLVHILHPRLVQYWLLYHTMVGITKLCLKIMRPFSFKYKILYPNTNLAFPSKNDL